MPTPKPKTADARIDARMAAERSKKRSPIRAPTMAPATAPRSPPKGNRPPSRRCIRAWDGLSVPTPFRDSVARSSTRDVIPAVLGLNLVRHLQFPSRPAGPFTQPETRSRASDACAGSSGYWPIGTLGRERNKDLFSIAARDCAEASRRFCDSPGDRRHWGIVTLIRGAVLYGIVLIIVGLLIGPGGVSIFC